MFKKKNNETENLVNSMFDGIVENNQIHESLKKLFNKLRKHYSKIAQKSPNLFAYDNHQARIFLQIAIQASINWHPECDQNNSFIKKIKSILKGINKSIKADKYESSNFIKYGEDLEAIITDVNKERKKQLKEKLLAEKKIEKAQQNANTTIITLLDGKKIPELVRYIIEEQWKNVLVLMYMRHSKQSNEYQQQLNFISLLIEVSLTTEQYNKKHCDNLLDEYKKGLKIVAFKSREINEQKNNLSEYLSDLFDDNLEKLVIEIHPEQDDKCLTSNEPNTNLSTKTISPENDIPDINAIPNINNKKAPEILKTATTIKLAETLQVDRLKDSKDKKSIVDYQQIVSGLKIGTWFELTDKDNSNTRVKLSWISPVSGKFLFVNANGLKITDKNNEELIENLKSNQIRIFKSFS